MRSRVHAGYEPARPSVSAAVARSNPAAWQSRWLSLDDHRLRLLNEWCECQRLLENQPGWFAFSDAARAELERNSGLSEIDGNLRAIHRRLRRWLRSIPHEPSRTIDGVVANLLVAERLLPIEENPIVHGLITRAARDLCLLHDRP